MDFEAFEVWLQPLPDSPRNSGQKPATLEALVSEVQSNWPEFRSDEIEIARLFAPLSANVALLVYETSQGLLQLDVQVKGNGVRFSIRFAYCNPRSVYEPFCDIVEGLMRRYELYCHFLSELAPQQHSISDEITSAEKIRAVLIPSMDYNRRLWQLDAQSEAEAILRPGDAVARFIIPLCLPTS